MNKNKFYNIIFPIWILFVFPPVILFMLPANFLIDSIVLLIALKLLKIQKIGEIYKKTIFKIWIFGFLSDIVGALFLLLSQFIPGDFWYDNILSNVVWNPFNNIFSFIYCLVALTISGVLIYFLNKKITFKNLNISPKNKNKIALSLAIITAPYLFLLPSSLIYKDYTEKIIGYNVIKIDNYNNDYTDIYKL